MKPPIATPMITSPSSTLTAAMIPSSRLVVANSPAMRTSEWRRLMRARVAWRLLAFAERVVQKLPPFVGDARRFLNGRAETHELAREIVECRLDLPPHTATVFGEKQIAGHTPDYCAYNCRRNGSR